MSILMEVNIPSLDIPLFVTDLSDNVLSAARVHADKTPTREIWLLCSVVAALVNMVISILGLTRFTNSINLPAHQVDIKLSYYVHLVNLILNRLSISKQILPEP